MLVKRRAFLFREDIFGEYGLFLNNDLPLFSEAKVSVNYRLNVFGAPDICPITKARIKCFKPFDFVVDILASDEVQRPSLVRQNLAYLHVAMSEKLEDAARKETNPRSTRKQREVEDYYKLIVKRMGMSPVKDVIRDTFRLEPLDSLTFRILTGTRLSKPQNQEGLDTLLYSYVFEYIRTWHERKNIMWPELCSYIRSFLESK
ncbi:hypothetical protein PM8797T_23249 [Gimesia maris DSM 8797]|nr:hypothetical protein PM8797T_23249 [Gimesia maris DSM 8797]